jgi:YD repeat-containing protein
MTIRYAAALCFGLAFTVNLSRPAAAQTDKHTLLDPAARIQADPFDFAELKAIASSNAFACDLGRLTMFDGRTGDYAPVTVTTEDWNVEGWVHSIQSTYNYDAQGNLIEYVSQDWQWANRSRVTAHCDGVRPELLMRFHSWYPVDSDWVIEGQDRFLYDEADNLAEWLYETFDRSTDTWTNISLTTYTYDDSNRVLEHVGYSWDEGLESWTERDRYRYQHHLDERGRIVETIGEQWDEQAGWMHESRSLYTYDAGGQLIERQHEHWSAEQWKSEGRTTYLYDDAGHQIEYTSWDWVNTDQTWEATFRDRFTFDARGLQTERLREDWNAATEEWTNRWLTQHHYARVLADEQPTDLPHESSIHISQLYPNPTASEARIQLSLPRAMSVQVEVFDVMGRPVSVLHDGPMQTEHTLLWNADNRPNGMYMIRVQGDGFTETKPVMLVR